MPCAGSGTSRVASPRAGEWLERSLHISDERAAGNERSLALISAGHLAWVQGDYQNAHRWLTEGVALARLRDDKTVLADGFIHLGFVLVGHDEAQRARFEEEGLAISRELRDPWLSALALHGGGVLALGRGDRAAARGRLQESLTLWLEIGDTWFAAQALNALGDLARAETDYATAEERYARALELLRQHGIRHGTASVLQNLGYVRHHLGNDRQALALFSEALELFANQGDHRGIAECLAGMGVCALGLGEPAAAVRLLGAGDGLLASVGMAAWPSNARVVDEVKAAARAHLAPGAYTQLYAEGRALAVADALRYAREPLARPGAGG